LLEYCVLLKDRVQRERHLGQILRNAEDRAELVFLSLNASNRGSLALAKKYVRRSGSTV